MPEFKRGAVAGLQNAQSALQQNLFSRGGGGLDAAMAFMGLPNMGARQNYGYGMGPGGQPVAPYGQVPGQNDAKPPTTGGQDPGMTDEEKKRQAMIKAGLTPWYVDWLNTSGQYGGIAPTKGLLDG